ncbi:MAG: chromosomal replication initiation protein, partial [Acidimicrobiia bacterium]|nr:chromosomal replication initiation protein [Acidimicrobiia bacterium]
MSQSLRAQVSDAVWYSTFNDVHAVSVSEDTLRLAVPSGTVRDKILSRYYPIVLDAMAEAGAGSRNLVVEVVAPESAVIDVTPVLTARPADVVTERVAESEPDGAIADRAGLNPRYTFETFVRGASNSFALAAA